MYNELWSLLIVTCLGTCEVGVQDYGLTESDCWQEYALYTELLGTADGMIQFDCVVAVELPAYRFIPDYIMLEELCCDTVYKF